MTVSPSPLPLTGQFLVQFIRFHRGAPEVTRTLSLTAANSTNALERAKTLIDKGSWPALTDALHVMDEGGRTLIKWNIPPPTSVPAKVYQHSSSQREVIGSPPLSLVLQEIGSNRDTATSELQPHLFAVGEPVSFAEDGPSDTWKGGYDIVRLREANVHEPQYAIRSADDSHDRIVQEHELQKDLGARVRGH